MKRMIVLFVMLAASVGFAQDSRQEYRRHFGLDTLSLGATPGKFIYSSGDSLFFKPSSGSAVKFAPPSGFTGTGTSRYFPYFSGTSTIANSYLRNGLSNGDVELVGSASTRKFWFVEDGVTDSGFVFLNSTATLSPWIEKGLQLGTVGGKGATVWGDLRVISGSLGQWGRIRGKLFAGDLDSGTISASRLPSVGPVGSYTNSNITVDQYGRIIAASNGTAGTTSTNATILAGRSVDTTSRVIGSLLTFNGTTYSHKKGVDVTALLAGYIPYSNSDTTLRYSPLKVESSISGLGVGNIKFASTDAEISKLVFSIEADSGYISPRSGGGLATSSMYVNGAVSQVLGTISASNIDWAIDNGFDKTISGNTTFTFSNVPSTGITQTLNIRIINTGAYTVSWPGTVKWSGGSAPVQTTGTKTDIYTFISFGGTVYGSVVQNFSN